ncbi:hypothetical protein DFH27DRAFT_547891 [Peziza echinospora]|nr:hypothetical protein DFH27DRAFT_547891 [Peziza echinospora]
MWKSTILFTSFVPLLWSWIGTVAAQNNNQQQLRVLAPNGNETAGVKYNLQNDYCWLLAHQSVLIDGHTIAIDSGITKFGPIKLPNGESVYIVDLNGELTRIDTSKRFMADQVQLNSTQKPINVPVVSRGSLWYDSTGQNLYIQGGRYYNEANYTQSKYYTPKNLIPDYSVWRYNIPTGIWLNIADELQFPDGRVQRAFGGAALSMPQYNMSYFFGGYFGETTIRDWPLPGKSLPQAGLLTFDHTTRTLRNESIESYDNNRGSWHGTLLPLNPAAGKNKTEKGLLLSLMAESGPLGQLFGDLTVNGSIGDVADFTKIKFYDISLKKWYTQQTRYWDGEKPIPRTRFCADIVHEEGSGTYELYVYGGQQVEDSRLGVDDIWALTMPAFVWIKIPIPNNFYKTRSHTCHAIGKNLVILGGTNPGTSVNQATPCDQSFVKIWNLNEPGWINEFVPGTKYVAPAVVRNSSALAPLGGLEWADKRVEQMFKAEGDGSSGKRSIVGPAVGGTLGGVALVAALLLFFWYIPRRRRQRRERAGAVEAQARAQALQAQAQAAQIPRADLTHELPNNPILFPSAPAFPPPVGAAAPAPDAAPPPRATTPIPPKEFAAVAVHALPPSPPPEPSAPASVKNASSTAGLTGSTQISTEPDESTCNTASDQGPGNGSGDVDEDIVDEAEEDPEDSDIEVDEFEEDGDIVTGKGMGKGRGIRRESIHRLSQADIDAYGSGVQT